MCALTFLVFIYLFRPQVNVSVNGCFVYMSLCVYMCFTIIWSAGIGSCTTGTLLRNKMRKSGIEISFMEVL